MSKGSQVSGFTLIEFVIVIALLGILAAIALPRFMNAQDDAHAASVKGTGGAMASAVILLRSQWLTNGSAGAVDGVSGFGNDLVATSSQGWPTDAGQGTASNHSPIIGGTAERCVEIWKALLLVGAPTVSITSNVALENPDYEATSPGSGCIYTYRNSVAGSTIEYDPANGAVVINI